MPHILANESCGTLAIVSLASDGTLSRSHPRNSLNAAFRHAFLPEAWPDSVTPDYLGFQLWDTLQALSSYVRGMLTTHALLIGVGVGSQTATPLNAALSFFARDCFGWLGGLVFAAARGASFDGLAKQWRLSADVANDIGLTLELAAPLFPSAFLLLACVGAACRAVTGVAGGATRYALTQHFARAGNAADVAAKEASQETATTLVGMVFGMALTKLAVASQPAAWAAFWLLTVLHVWANVKALRCLQLTSLNRPRLDILLREYAVNGEVLPPEALSARESLMPPPLASLLCLLRLRAAPPDIHIAPPLSSLSWDLRQGLAEHLSQLSSKERASLRYWVVPVSSQAHTVLLHPEAQAVDILEAYCLALLRYWGNKKVPNVHSPWDGTSPQQQRSGSTRLRRQRADTDQPDALYTLALADTDSWVASGGFQAFVRALEAAGWGVDRVALLQGQNRLDWSVSPRKPKAA